MVYKRRYGKKRRAVSSRSLFYRFRNNAMKKAGCYVPKRRTQYRRKYSLKNTNNRYVTFTDQETTDLLLAPGLNPGSNASTIQSLFYQTITPSAFVSTNLRLKHYFDLYQYYRIENMCYEVIPNALQVTTGTLNALGQVVMVPIHSQGDIVASGISGSSAIVQTNADTWAEMKHAKVAGFRNGAMVPLKMNISPSVFAYNYINPSFGVVGSSSTARPEFTARRWYSTRDYDGGSTSMSQMIHYGAAVMFAGFDTPATYQAYRVRYRITWAFKDLDPTTSVITYPMQEGAPKPITYFTTLKELQDSKLPNNEKALCPFVRVDFEEGKMIRRVDAKEYHKEMMVEARQHNMPNPRFVEEDHYQEVDQDEIDEKSDDMPPLPLRKRLPSPTPSVSKLKRAYTNMKM